MEITPLEMQDEIMRLTPKMWVCALEQIVANFADRGIGKAPLTKVPPGAWLRVKQVRPDDLLVYDENGRLLVIERRELHKLSIEEKMNDAARERQGGRT